VTDDTIESLSMLPPIRRARGARLYAADGRRFLDFWMDDGRCILGERDARSRTAFKDMADKGLTRLVPGHYLGRFEKSLALLYPEWKAVRVFMSERDALLAAARIVGGTPRMLDAAAASSFPLAEDTSRAVAIVRPFAQDLAGARLAVARVPLARPLAPACLVARDEADFAGERGDLVPQAMLFAGARAVREALSLADHGYDEAYWKSTDRRLSPYFARRGPFLFPGVSGPGEWKAFFRAAMDGGALLSPGYGDPCFIPPECSDGELKRLADSLSRLPSATPRAATDTSA